MPNIQVGDGSKFSLIEMVLHADPVVQAIIAGLIVASVISWAIFIEKTVRLWLLRREVYWLEEHAAAGQLPTGGRRNGLLTAIATAAEAERVEGADRSESSTDVRLRVERAMRGALRTELKRMEGGLPFLATLGSAAPFIGLFGTVWGIMHSFTAIAQSKDTSLAVVAPGIAEALFATAIGLGAAIPAVIAYNQVTVSLGRVAERAGSAIALISRAVCRPATHPHAQAVSHADAAHPRLERVR